MNTSPDPYRIKRILNKLEDVWADQPDDRFSEVIEELFYPKDSLAIVGDAPTDKKLEKSLDRYLKDHKVEAWKS